MSLLNLLAMIVGYFALAIPTVFMGAVVLERAFDWLYAAWKDKQERNAMIEEIIWRSQQPRMRRR